MTQDEFQEACAKRGITKFLVPLGIDEVSCPSRSANDCIVHIMEALRKKIRCLRIEYGTPECLVLEYLGAHKHRLWGRGPDICTALLAAWDAAFGGEKKDATT